MLRVTSSFVGVDDVDRVVVAGAHEHPLEVGRDADAARALADLDRLDRLHGRRVEHGDGVVLLVADEELGRLGGAGNEERREPERGRRPYACASILSCWERGRRPIAVLQMRHAPQLGGGTASSCSALIGNVVAGFTCDIERCLAKVILSRRIGSFAQQKPDHWSVVVPGRDHERRHAGRGLGIDVGAVLDQLGRRCRWASGRPARCVVRACGAELRGNEHQRRDLLLAAGRVDLGARFDQRLGRKQLVLADGDLERRVALLVVALEVGALGEPATRSTERGCG